MGEEAVVGEWGDFNFKMVKPQDQEKVLQHLRDHFYEPAFAIMGYTKAEDDELELTFKAILNDGHNLSFFAEDKASGKVAACRVITVETMDQDDTAEPFKGRALRGIFKLYNGLKKESKLGERYKVDTFPHLFGISVDPEFRQQGLATEIYYRAKGLLKAKGYVFTFVGFTSPFSRAAAMHHGYIQTATAPFVQAVDEENKPLNPLVDPAAVFYVGVIEL